MSDAEGSPIGYGVGPGFLRRILDTAERAARDAGELQLERFRRGGRVEAFRRHDLKLTVDRLSEETIASVISRTFPGHAILGEEAGRRSGRAGWLWIVDPLDGSVNFHHGIPQFCVSLACHRLPHPAVRGESGTDRRAGRSVACAFRDAL